MVLRDCRRVEVSSPFAFFFWSKSSKREVFSSTWGNNIVETNPVHYIVGVILKDELT